MMELEYKDGQFVGADEYMKKLQEEDPDSFEKEKEEEETKPGSWVRGVNRKDRPSTLDADEAYLKPSTATTSIIMATTNSIEEERSNGIWWI